jgi:hypothetical protein
MGRLLFDCCFIMDASLDLTRCSGLLYGMGWRSVRVFRAGIELLV